MSRVIGIDLGTTNSVVAFVENGKPEAIPNAQGSRLTPSVVMFKDGDEPVVGELAKRQLLTAPGYGVRSAKRIIGQRYSEVADRIEDFPYRVIEAEEGRAEIQLDGDRVVSPEEVGAHVLASLRDAAEDYLGESVDQAVITVPAYFNDAQRTATKRAAEMAGIEVLRLLNEPTAAALAYGAGKQNDEIVAVFDFGGGTFDISILQLQGDIFEVLATCGDTNLGGDNLDFVLFTDICDGIIQSTGIDPTQDPQATARIHEAAEKAKIELSNMEQTEISLPFIVADKNGPKHFSKSLSREQFIRMVTPVLERLIPPCKQAMSDAGVGPEKIRNVLLVGGSTRIPRVQEMVKELFRREPNRSVNPDEVVALGAAVQASAMTGALQELLLLDVTPLSLGIEVAGGAFKPLIARNSSIPCEATRKFATVVDNQTSVLVNVLQGERKIASENRLLARFRLTGIAPMPAELAEIQVRFNIDANGILQVTAVDLTSGVETGVVIEGYGQLAMDKREIQRAVEEASKSAIEDEQFIQFADRKAKADRLQAQVNQMLELAADAILEEDMKTIKETIFRHDLAIRDRNLRAMEEQEDKLNDLLGKYEAAIKIGVELMKKAKAREQFSTGGAPRLEDQIRAQSAAEQQQDVPPTPPEQMMQEVPGQPEPTGGAEKSELHKVARRGGDPTAEPEIYEQAKNLAALPPPPPPPPRRKG